MTHPSGKLEPRHGDDEDYDGTLAFLYDRINYERLISGRSRYPFRLRRIRQLLSQLDLGRYLYAVNPTPPVPLVHIAGTKGKGSTADMVASILAAAGIRTGLYTSPHLHSLEERFRVDGQPCTRQDLVWLVERIKPATQLIQQSMGPVSFFELTTALALLHFDTRACQAIVLEVGLGGRLDSTNVCAPSVSAVTSIGLDHQHVLGHDLKSIAAEKAGIFKPQVPVVSAVTDGDASSVIAAKAAAKNSPLYQLGRDFRFQHSPLPEWGSHLEFSAVTPPLSRHLQATLSMDGEHQARNAAVAIGLVDLLRAQGLAVTDEAIAQGLGRLQCCGRIERFVLADDVTVIVDAAHNHDSMAVLRDCLGHRFKNRPIAVVFGTSVDKTARPMLESLAEVTGELVLTRFKGNPRYQPPNELLPLVPKSMAGQTTVVEDPVEACNRGLKSVTPGGVLVICGSFFLAAETRPWVAARAKA